MNLGLFELVLFILFKVVLLLWGADQGWYLYVQELGLLSEAVAPAVLVAVLE